VGSERIVYTLARLWIFVLVSPRPEAAVKCRCRIDLHWYGYLLRAAPRFFTSPKTLTQLANIQDFMSKATNNPFAQRAITSMHDSSGVGGGAESGNSKVPAWLELKVARPTSKPNGGCVDPLCLSPSAAVGQVPKAIGKGALSAPADLVRGGWYCRSNEPHRTGVEVRRGQFRLKHLVGFVGGALEPLRPGGREAIARTFPAP